MQHRGIKILSLALLGSSVLVPAVAAQDSDQVMSIYERYRPDLSAKGIRTGGFLFYPEIKAEGEFDSNIYATDDNNVDDVDDFIAIVKPSFRLQSNWNSNSFALFAGADIGRYADNSAEDYEDFNVGASGRIDMSHGSNIFVDLTYADMHEDRGSPDSVGTQAEATTFSTLKAIAGFKRDEGVMSFAVDGSYEKNDYDDARLNGGGRLENDDRDRETIRSSVRIGFDLNDDYEAFVKFATVAVEYDDSRLDGGPLRDSDGWDVVGGAAFNVGGSSVGEFYVGYVKRDFDKASFADASEMKFGASMLWSGDLTSFKVAIDRDVAETTLEADNASGQRVASAGILSTSYSARIEHELRRNLLLGADISYNKMDFINTVRDDDVTKLGLGAKYLLNRTFSLNADYKFDKRSTNEVNQDYKRHSFIVSLGAQW